MLVSLFDITLLHSVAVGNLYPDAIEIVLVPLVVIAEVEEDVSPVPVLIVTDVTVPVLAVAPGAIPSNFVLSVLFIRPEVEVVASASVADKTPLASIDRPFPTFINPKALEEAIGTLIVLL